MMTAFMVRVLEGITNLSRTFNLHLELWIDLLFLLHQCSVSLVCSQWRAWTTEHNIDISRIKSLTYNFEILFGQCGHLLGLISNLSKFVWVRIH